MLGRYLMGCCALAIVAVGCLIDEADVCGAHQRRLEQGFLEGCVCEDGAVPNKDGIGCHACGEHEVVKAEACACETGYARASAGDACTPAEASNAGPDAGAGDGAPGTRGQDMPCDSSSECAGLDATYCLTLLAPTRCLVQGCADGTKRCASDRECCAITVLPELAATGGLCVAKGECMAPGMVVAP